MLVGCFDPFIASVECVNIFLRPGRIIWPMHSIVLVMKLHVFYFRVALSSRKIDKTCFTWLICSSGERGETMMSPRITEQTAMLLETGWHSFHVAMLLVHSLSWEAFVGSNTVHDWTWIPIYHAQSNQHFLSSSHCWRPSLPASQYTLTFEVSSMNHVWGRYWAVYNLR